MATVKDLFKLANATYGEANKIAMGLLLEALNKLDWETLDGNLLTPLAAAYETLPEGPAYDGYRVLLMKTSDYCRSLQREAEKVPLLQTAFDNLYQNYKAKDRSLTIQVDQDGGVTVNRY